MIVNVTVFSDGTTTQVSPHVWEDPILEAGGPAGISAVTTIYNMMKFSQTSLSNVVGDQLSSLTHQWSGNYTDVPVELRFLVCVTCDG